MNDPKIIYTIVAYKNKILCDYCEKSGDLIDYIRDNVLPVTSQQGKRIINEEAFDHLYIRDEHQICILVTTDTEFSKEIGFQYIKDIQQQLLRHYGVEKLKKASKNSLTDIRDYIKDIVKDFNMKWQDLSKVGLAKANQIKDAITINMKNIQERNLQFNQMEDSSQLISESSQILMENANKLKKKAQREYYKALCIYVGLALFALYILLMIICGGFTLAGCFGQVNQQQL